MNVESEIHERFFVGCSFEAHSGCFLTEWSSLTIMRGRGIACVQEDQCVSRIVTAAEICSMKKIYFNLREFTS